jgi:N-methylhydantoinase A/oxoprolinase/acetone carboxylase beta subunit
LPRQVRCKGAFTALITTEGLRDAVEIGYEHHFAE